MKIHDIVMIGIILGLLLVFFLSMQSHQNRIEQNTQDGYGEYILIIEGSEEPEKIDI